MTDETIFANALLKLSPQERAAYLVEACGNDPARLKRIEGLLRPAADIAPRFLEEPAVAAGSQVTWETSQVPAPDISESGLIISEKYKLVQMLGEGGMGTVYLAEQTQPVIRKVAIKIVKPGMDTKTVLRRFEAERQALAIMDHPNIAKVFDAGTTADGRPFFAMELVQGTPITRYCDQHHLLPDERLELFIRVCQAVQHAHQKGIIHRDLKPGNVLVTLYDGKPVPKVIDFGVAKAIDQKLTEQTMLTEVGMIIGTMEYMSPEQAELNNLDIDTRTDIYSLGVILYELLSGSTPFTKDTLRKAAFTEMLRCIREVEPDKPSTRLSTSDQLPDIAANRKLEPKRLKHLVQGDLDWIAMKALSKERERRYESAHVFAMDIQRYLADEPVLAGPPSAAYRFRKFFQRNKGKVLSAGVVLTSLVLGTIGATWGWIEAKQQRNMAEEAQDNERKLRIKAQESEKEAKESTDVAVTLRNFWEEHVIRGASVERQFDRRFNRPHSLMTVRDLLKHVALEVNNAFPDRPLMKAHLQKVIGVTLREIGEYQSALPHLESSALIYKAHLGDNAFETVDIMNSWAVALTDAGKHKEANGLLEDLVPRLEKHHPEKSQLILSASNNLCLTYDKLKRYDQAIKGYEQLLERQERTLSSNDSSKCTTLSNLAHSYLHTGQWEKALGLFQKASAFCNRILVSSHPTSITIEINQLLALYEGKRYEEAATRGIKLLPLAKKILGEQHPNYVVLHSHLAHAHFRLGHHESAAEHFTQVFNMEKTMISPPSTLEYKLAMAVQEWIAAERDDQAEPLVRELLSLRQKSQKDSWKLFNSMCLLGKCLLVRKQYAEALPLLEKGYLGMSARFTTMPPETHYNVTNVLDALIRLSVETEKSEDVARWKAERQKYSQPKK